MDTEEGCNIATRYRIVRKHLDSLGYKQALTLDALPLIEKLVADLAQTTESLQHFKDIAKNNIEACSRLQLSVDPYKCDNARLVQECNDLHLELIRDKEVHQKRVKDLKREISTLEKDYNDLQLASSRNLEKIKELEIESSKKSKKILELQGKCCKPIINNINLAHQKRACYPLKRPTLESEPLPNTPVSSKSSLNTVEPKYVDLLSIADNRISGLQHEIRKLNGELSSRIDETQTLKKQLSANEEEIHRLKEMLGGGRPYSAVTRDCSCGKIERNFSASGDTEDDDLRILRQAKLQLEQQLKDALNKQHDAMTQAMKLAERNEELEKELQDIDHIVLAIEADCNSAVKENNRRVSRLQERLENVTAHVHTLQRELTVERREAQELRADLEACKVDKRNIQRTLETTLEEKKSMTDKINRLTASASRHPGHSSVSSTKDTLYNADNYLEASKKDKVTREANNIRFDIEKLNERISYLQESVRKLETERDSYRNECHKLQHRCNTESHTDDASLLASTYELRRQLSEKDHTLAELYREREGLHRERAKLEEQLEAFKKHRQPCTVCRPCSPCRPVNSNRNDSGMKALIKHLENEKDTAKADVERLLQERDALRESLKIAADTHSREQNRLRENLNEVQTRLNHSEGEKQDLLRGQGAVKTTIRELQSQLKDVREELSQTKQELATQRTQYFQLRALQDQTDQALGDVQGQLSRSEAELNEALVRNRSMSQQQVQFDNQAKELKQEINVLRTTMAQLDHEKDQLLMVLDEKTERIAALERELQFKEQQAAGTEQQIRELQHKNDICIDQNAEQERQLRTMQLELEDLQRQVDAASMDRDNAIQENRSLQDDLAAVTCEVRTLQQELEASRAESYDLKRQLQTYVSEVRRAEELLNRKENERTEMLNHFRSLSLEATVLESNNQSLESEAAETRGVLQSARDRLVDLEHQLADRDSLIKGYETQIGGLTQAVASLETQLCQETEQRQRLEADLHAVRDLCVNLDQQKDALMQRLESKEAATVQYERQVAKLMAEQSIVEDKMSKDRTAVDRLEALLDQARQASIEAQATNQELRNEISRLKQTISDLRNRLSSESSELKLYQNQVAEYSKQISELRRQVTNERFDRARKDEENRRSLNSTPDSVNVDLNVII